MSVATRACGRIWTYRCSWTRRPPPGAGVGRRPRARPALNLLVPLGLSFCVSLCFGCDPAPVSFCFCLLFCKGDDQQERIIDYVAVETVFVSVLQDGGCDGMIFSFFSLFGITRRFGSFSVFMHKRRCKTTCLHFFCPRRWERHLSGKQNGDATYIKFDREMIGVGEYQSSKN